VNYPLVANGLDAITSIPLDRDVLVCAHIVVQLWRY